MKDGGQGLCTCPIIREVMRLERANVLYAAGIEFNDITSPALYTYFDSVCDPVGT